MTNLICAARSNWLFNAFVMLPEEACEMKRKARGVGRGVTREEDADYILMDGESVHCPLDLMFMDATGGP